MTSTETTRPKKSAPLMCAMKNAEGQRERSYPVDPLDHQQQDREHHDPENDCHDVHAITIGAARVTAA